MRPTCRRTYGEAQPVGRAQLRCCRKRTGRQEGDGERGLVLDCAVALHGVGPGVEETGHEEMKGSPHPCPSPPPPRHLPGRGSAPPASFSTSLPRKPPGDSFCFRADNTPFELCWICVKKDPNELLGRTDTELQTLTNLELPKGTGGGGGGGGTDWGFGIGICTLR